MKNFLFTTYLVTTFFSPVLAFTTPDQNLLAAAEAGDLAGVTAALNAGAQVNAKDADGDTALMRAAGRDKTEIVKFLIAAKANVNQRDQRGMTALMAANNNPEIIKLLIAAKANVNLAEKRESSRGDDDGGRTALMFAANNKNKESMKLMIEAGANVNMKSLLGHTALMLATHNAECVQLLLEAKANVNVKNSFGGTALLEAVEGGRSDIVKLLIVAKADVNAKDKNGQTPLMAAAKEDLFSSRKKNLTEDQQARFAAEFAEGSRKFAEITASLIEAKANVNAQSLKDGKTALHIAAETGGNIETAKRLVDAHAHIDVKDKYGNTPLMYAVNADRDALVKYFIDSKADLNLRNKSGHTALLLAIGNSSFHSLKLLIQANADLNTADEDGRTPLMRSIEKERVFKGLQNDERYKPYWAQHKQSAKELRRLSKYLIEAKVDLNKQDNKGDTALTYAARSDNEEISNLLKAAGAK